jgi:hypothetical protein
MNHKFGDLTGAIAVQLGAIRTLLSGFSEECFDSISVGGSWSFNSEVPFGLSDTALKIAQLLFESPFAVCN